MSDDQATPHPPPPQPPLPEEFSIPRQVLDKWLSIPHADYINARLTRQDIDNLFFAINRSLQAQTATHDCLISWSNGSLVDANASLHNSKRLLIESGNNLRQFFTGLASSAVPENGDNVG
jgi:hypothetical protein